jgi:hypothetical protein
MLDLRYARAVHTLPGVWVEPAGQQSRQPVAPTRAAEENRHLVADEFAAAAREDSRATDQARQAVLVVAGQQASAPATVLSDAPADLDSAGAERIAFLLRLQYLGPREEDGRSV